MADERRKSVSDLVKVLLGSRGPTVLDRHIKELLTILLWKLTEADSPKYKTRFQSRAALERLLGDKLHHEHVYQRSKMIEELFRASPEKIDEILALAVGCTITLDEAGRLLLFDSDYGWERYRKAGIEVLDTAQNPPVPFIFPD
jgi:hypothetical protein